MSTVTKALLNHSLSLFSLLAPFKSSWVPLTLSHNLNIGHCLKSHVGHINHAHCQFQCWYPERQIPPITLWHLVKFDQCGDTSWSPSVGYVTRLVDIYIFSVKLSTVFENSHSTTVCHLWVQKALMSSISAGFECPHHSSCIHRTRKYPKILGPKATIKVTLQEPPKCNWDNINGIPHRL